MKDNIDEFDLCECGKKINPYCEFRISVKTSNGGEINSKSNLCFSCARIIMESICSDGLIKRLTMNLKDMPTLAELESYRVLKDQVESGHVEIVTKNVNNSESKE